MNEFTSEWMKKIKSPTIELTKLTEVQNNPFVGFGGSTIGHSKKLILLSEDEINDQKAYESGFNTLQPGEVYMRQVTASGIVFIIKNEAGKFDAWRETWSQKEPKSVSSKDVAMGATFDYAILKAKQYIGYFTKFGGI